MKRIHWLDFADCVALHEMMLSMHGGLAGIRDSGLLESALARPRNLQSYGSPDISQLAASYAFGIILNHPFLDGNKRTGFMLAALFLELNGRKLTATEESVVEMTLGLAARRVTEEQYSMWLKDNSRTQTN